MTFDSLNYKIKDSLHKNQDLHKQDRIKKLNDEYNSNANEYQ